MTPAMMYPHFCRLRCEPNCMLHTPRCMPHLRGTPACSMLHLLLTERSHLQWYIAVMTHGAASAN